MKTTYTIRYASNPVDAKQYDTARLRKEFLIETLFAANEVNIVYSMIDRMIVGGAMPKGEAPVSYTHLTLPTNREVWCSACAVSL